MIVEKPKCIRTQIVYEFRITMKMINKSMPSRHKWTRHLLSWFQHLPSFFHWAIRVWWRNWTRIIHKREHFSSYLANDISHICSYSTLNSIGNFLSKPPNSNPSIPFSQSVSILNGTNDLMNSLVGYKLKFKESEIERNFINMI